MAANTECEKREKAEEYPGGHWIDGSLSPTKVADQPKKFEEVHGKIVLQHAYLTNGMSEFMAELFPSTVRAFERVKIIRFPVLFGQQTPVSRQQKLGLHEELVEYVNHMHVRARSELQHRERMLARLNIYLQVVSLHGWSISAISRP